MAWLNMNTVITDNRVELDGATDGADEQRVTCARVGLSYRRRPHHARAKTLHMHAEGAVRPNCNDTNLYGQSLSLSGTYDVLLGDARPVTHTAEQPFCFEEVQRGVKLLPQRQTLSFADPTPQTHFYCPRIHH